MRAMVLAAQRQPLRFSCIAEPLPGPGQVKIRIHACAVCRTDLHLRDAEIEAPKLPVILGHQIVGRTEDGRRVAVRLTPPDSPAANYAFDVTPARLVTGLITERGICPASRDGLLGLFPERDGGRLTTRH